jgi:hypothetical protein
MTEDEVRQLIAAKNCDAFDLDTVCLRCSYTWGKHIPYLGGACADPNNCTILLGTFFLPRGVIANPNLVSVKLNYPIKYHALPPKENTTAEIPDWKRWRNDQPGCCPCGITRADCWIHKD